MIFYPIHFRGIPLIVREGSPLGLLGWQGIVPAKSKKMSEAMVDMVTEQLLDVREVFGRLDAMEVAVRLKDGVAEVSEGIVRSRFNFIRLPRFIYSCNVRFISAFVRKLQANIVDTIDLKHCVTTQMLEDRSKLGKLFQICGQAELNFLTNSGLWFGFLLGMIQMCITLLWDNPWVMSVGGGVVGFATNWLALKWIFQPVNPTKVGPFVLQGMFLKRQKEVSETFSKFFANNILTSEKMFDSILTNPTTRTRFERLFHGHLTRYLPFLGGGGGAIASEAVSGLSGCVSSIHGYVDNTLGLENTLRLSMLKMTSKQFERVLHPIFEEDELTLIIAGAILGFIAGLIQQGFASGRFKRSKNSSGFEGGEGPR